MQRGIPGVVLLGALIGARLFGQVVSGSIVGNISDTTGAAVSSARVSLGNIDTGQTRLTVSNEAGAYAFPTLPPGRYRVTAEKAGFKSAVSAVIELQIDQTARLDTTLQVGEVSEQVLVSAEGTRLQTDSATLGQVISEKPVAELPLNGRSFLQLATLSPGVIPPSPTSSQSALEGRTNVTVTVAGGRANSNSFLIDGMESRAGRFGETSMMPSTDAIEEFKIQRNYYSAEYGTSPAIISVSIKSGSNGFHGDAYDFLRNSFLDARQFFDGASPPPFRQNQFGATLGGPVIENKTFFFVAYEGQRSARLLQQFGTMPNPQWLAGNFAGLAAAIKDPFNGGAPFPGNQIPAARLSKIATNFNQYIPAPNTSLAQGNYRAQPATLNSFDQYHVRADHRISLADSIFGRLSNSNWSLLNHGLTPYSGASYPLDGTNAVIEETHIFGPTLVNTLKLGYSRGVGAAGNETSSTNIAAQLGLQNLSVPAFDYSLPRFTITGITQMGHSAQTFREWTNAYDLSDTMAWIHGEHHLSLGGDIRQTRTPSLTVNGTNGRFTMDGRFTGNSFADYLLGAYATATSFVSNATGDYRFGQFAAFVQDDYHVSKRLTLNLGLRWEYTQPWHDNSGAEGYFDPSIPGLRLEKPPSAFGVNITAPWIVVGGVRPGVFPPQHHLFAPRVGLAYSVTSRTVVRAGVGIFYGMDNGNHTVALSVNPGAAITESFTNSPGTIPRLMDTLFDPPAQAALGVSNTLITEPVNRKIPYVEQWNVNVQHEFRGGFVAEVGYVGSGGRQLDGNSDENLAVPDPPGQNLPLQSRRPYPQFGGLSTWNGGENSSYNALMASLERRFAGGVYVMTNYTWSKSLDTNSSSLDDSGIPHVFTTNYKMDRSVSDFNVGQRYTASAIWELPFGEGKAYLAGAKGIVGRLVSGWQANTIVQLQTGLPFSVVVVGDRANIGFTGAAAGQRPDRIANGNLPPSEQTPNRWFDTSAFVLQPVNTLGNAGRLILSQDGTKSVDFSLFKNNYFGERRVNLQLRAEIFNLLNNVNFGRPGNQINGPHYGVVTTAGDARECQLAVKVVF
jgi:outer membrane receptor protein involved in Fe transport